MPHLLYFAIITSLQKISLLHCLFLTGGKNTDIMGSESRKHMDSLFLFTERSISHEVEYQNHKASFH